MHSTKSDSSVEQELSILRMRVLPPSRVRAFGTRSSLFMALLLLGAWMFGSVLSNSPTTAHHPTVSGREANIYANGDTTATTCQKKLRILSINAANGVVDWRLVEQSAAAAAAVKTNATAKATTDISSSSLPWSIEEITLDGFGTIMKEQSFQSALDYFESELRSIFTTTTSGEDDTMQKQKAPIDVLIVSSKGVNILTFLATNGIWRGPSILLSPIPNSCDHIDGTSWETEWKSTMTALVSHHSDTPLVIGIGTSFDEQYLIAEMMEETNVCGRLIPTESEAHTTPHALAGGFFFATCPTWYLQSFHGNHSWKNDADNIPNLAMLIHRAASYW